MTRFRIFDGALLILEKRPCYSLGQTVLAELPGKDYVLRWLGRQSGHLTLFGGDRSIITVTEGIQICGLLLWVANPHCETKWDVLAVH